MNVSQSAFHEALLSPDRPVPDGLSDGMGHPAGRRFSVYRNNVAASLTEALELSFPCIAKLIGAENFRSLAGLFLRQHPPRVPMLSQYGAEMPAFLERFAPLQHLGYLPDVACLEQAIRLSYHAQDAQAVDPQVLQALSPDDLTAARVTLAPALRLVRSSWPVHAIWAYNLENGPKPQAGAQDVLITRPGFDPQLTPIGPGTAAFVTSLRQGKPLGVAHDIAIAAEAGFDLTAALGLLLAGNGITRINAEISE